MNEQKVREVLDFVYEEVHGLLSYRHFEGESFVVEALEAIEAKIETLTDDDLGKETTDEDGRVW